MTKVVPRPALTFWESAYFTELCRGLFITLQHAGRSLAHPASLPTLNYPEVKSPIPRGHRSRHRLMKRPDGSPRCVACFLCATACPARCIHIVANASPDHHIEKRPAAFDIDLLLCVFCGLCVEACPCDAIRMDTGLASLVGDSRRDLLIDQAGLLAWEPRDYPEDDVLSQQAPGGKQHAEALRRFTSGTAHS
jgi:NADH-quinone oxidoreductase subunit I